MGSGGSHRLRLRALGTGAHLEDDLLTLGQHLVPVHVDGGVVHENVLPATVHGDEAVALLRVEPFDDTAGHARVAPCSIGPRIRADRRHDTQAGGPEIRPAARNARSASGFNTVLT